MRIRLSQPEIFLAERTETSLRFNWYKMPQAESYQYRFSVNDSGFSAWQTVDRFSAKLAGLSPGDRVIFRLRAERDGVYSRMSRRSPTRPLPAPTATSIPPTATATDAPPTATSIPPTAATDATADRDFNSADSHRHRCAANGEFDTADCHRDFDAADPPRQIQATATVNAAPRYVVDTAGNQNAHVRACPRTTCDILAKFAPGTEVEVLGAVSGETVYGIDIWYEINLEDGSAYIHSELAEQAE